MLTRFRLTTSIRFFIPYFFVVYEPNHAPEEWRFTTCTVVSKSAQGLSASRESQDMFYTIFTVRLFLNAR